MSKLQVQVLNGSNHPLPRYETPQAAGLDLRASLDENLTLEPGARALVKTDLYIAVPEGYEAQVRPRSGLAYNHGISVLNAPGTIDADFRGNVGVLLINHGNTPFTLQDGERIAQLVFHKYEQAEWLALSEMSQLGTTERGSGGFGSSGTK